MRKFSTVDDVPDSYFTDHRYIYGFVERVIDGDTIRIRHRPGFGILRQRPPTPFDPAPDKARRGISHETLSVRIYGVDCPEVAKNRNQVTQPYGDEAKEVTQKLVYNKMVKVTFLSRDQYRRAVAVVETVSPRFLLGLFKKDLSVQLARRGLAELYTSGGAQYNNNRENLEKEVNYAQRKRLGQWSLPKSERVSAAEHKKSKKTGIVATGTKNKASTTGVRSHIRRPRGRSSAAVAQSPPRRTLPGPRRQKTTEGLLDAAITGLDFIP